MNNQPEPESDISILIVQEINHKLQYEILAPEYHKYLKNILEFIDILEDFELEDIAGCLGIW